jgi:uncharacterized membrane protein
MVTLSGRSSSAVSVLTCTLIILGAAQAEATVTACNRSGSAMNVAIAYVPADPPGISTGGHHSTMVEGWWSLPPGECKHVANIHAGDHWVSFYAESKSTGRVLSGPEPRYCVSNRVMEERQQAGMSCRPGWRSVGFHRVDTNKSNFVFNIR